MTAVARAALLLTALCLLSGCTSAPSLRPMPDAAQHCMQVFIDDDARLAKAGIHDAQATPIAGHPYLRIDRLLASFTDSLTGPAQRAAWLTRAAALDAQARALEHARLSAPPDDAYEHQLQQCRRTLLNAMQTDEAAWPALLADATVADDYSDLRRALGAYALSSRVVLRGVKRMQQREMPRLLDAVEAAAIAATGYGATSSTDAAVPSLPWPQDALGIPEFGAEKLAALFRRHSPELAILTNSDDDTPGQITQDQPPYLDTTRATLYTHLAYTRFDNRVLPQLVYTWWFAARTAQSGIDPLAGALDGLSWRVTLDVDGTPLAYDVVHNCGCYHMFFPSARLRARALTDDSAEPPWIPFTVPAAWQGPLRVVLASGTHYVLGLAPASTHTPEHHYQLQPYEDLRNLPLGTGRVSLFDAQGLVPGSARGERWFLWPMGVVAAGSMRQWGHHATAFVGRRHFDEAHLLERYFERAASVSSVSD